MTKRFSNRVLKQAICRQGGVCAACGTPLHTPWSDGRALGHAHFLKPKKYNGRTDLDNCVYLCFAHHYVYGSFMAEFFRDERTGRTKTWLDLKKSEFKYWEYD